MWTGRAGNLILSKEFIDSEMATFPKSKYDDMMDCLSRVYDQDLNLVSRRLRSAWLSVRGGTWWKILEAGGGLLMLSKDEAVKIAERQRKESLAGLGEQYANTRKAIEFYNGDTMSYRDRVQFMDTNGAKKSAVVQFNDIQSPVDSVIGFMAQNRRRAVL